MCYTDCIETSATLSEGSKITTTISRSRLQLTRVLAVTSFTAYVYSQTRALLLPNPEAPELYAPNEYFLMVFFAASTLLNIFWLRQLFFRWDYAGDAMPLAYGWDEDEESIGLIKLETPFQVALPKTYGLSSAQVTCLPFHISGNLLMAVWGLAWVNGYFLLSLLLLAGNLSAQLYTVFLLLHVEEDEHITPINYLTHLVMKTNVGLAVLFMWKNWGVIDHIASPSTAQMINSGVIFLLMTIGSGPDPTVGLCLLYDLTALLFGQPKSDPWYHAFHWIMIVICVCLLVELHLSEGDKFSWLKGFEGLVARGPDHLDEDIEQHPKAKDVALWNESAVPPYLPSNF
ncbi:hypothetical protein BDN70DRAFT_870116 [Pholiota conissans]|uniref:Uncharacterized protein n=1 Tax=Pholiota conissans TaxID=109636 RepID=A0A9P5ZG74_9AGAR|nr:hypothetical protein BDN70DRAFT_870116 [Pholiota conissans]